MHIYRLAILLLLVSFSSPLFGKEESTDEELQSFSNALSKQVQESNRKKVAILDFTDLQNNPVEIGRYMAEQITVDLVTSKGGFKVVDRANLKSILDEHKLTTSGLVEADNVRKLGAVSGVDALILGNVVDLGETIQVTTKVIATDTAEIVAAVRGKFRKTSELAKLIEKTVPEKTKVVVATTPATSSSQPTIEKAPADPPNTQTVDPVELAVKSFDVRVDRNSSAGTAIFTLVNKSKNALALAFPRAPYLSCSILNRKGESIEYNEGSGINPSGALRAFVDSSPTILQAGRSVRCVIKFRSSLNPSLAQLPPFKFQLSLDVAETEAGRFSNIRTLEFLVDLKQ